MKYLALDAHILDWFLKRSVILYYAPSKFDC